MPNMSASFDYLRYIVRYTEVRCSTRYIFYFGKYFNLLAIIESSLFRSSPRGAPRDARVAGTPLRGPSLGPWIPAFAGMNGEDGAPPSPWGRRLLHECVGVARRHVDLRAADVGIQRLEHGVGGVGGVAGEAAVAGIHRQAGLDRLLVERRVAERVVRRHHGGDLLRRSGRDPFEAAHQRVHQRLRGA